MTSAVDDGVLCRDVGNVRQKKRFGILTAVLWCEGRASSAFFFFLEGEERIVVTPSV